MTRYKKILFFITAAALLLTSGFFIPTGALALTTEIVPSQCQNSSACGLCELGLAFKNATDIMIALAGPAAVVFLFWAALMFMMSGGSQSRVSEAKKIATAAVVGLLIVLFSWIILNTLVNSVFQAKGQGGIPLPWDTIDCTALIYPSISTIPPVGTPLPPTTTATTTCPYTFGSNTGLISGVSVTQQYPHRVLGLVTLSSDPGIQQNITATVNAFNALKSAATAVDSAAFGNMTMNSLYRPYLYQAHLFDLYTLNNNAALAADNNCISFRLQVQGLLQLHSISLSGTVGLPSMCGTTSKHVIGAGVDIGGGFTSVQYGQLNSIAQANNIPLTWRNYQNDPAHFDLVNPPYTPSSCSYNGKGDWY